jgi:hypothetical protein
MRRYKDNDDDDDDHEDELQHYDVQIMFVSLLATRRPSKTDHLRYPTAVNFRASVISTLY